MHRYRIFVFLLDAAVARATGSEQTDKSNLL